MTPARAGRRRLGPPPRITGRGVNTYLVELQEWLHKLWHSESGGVPSGFKEITPTTLDPNAPPSTGNETNGWAAADHVHALDLLLTAVGDLLTRDGSGYVRIGVGTDGQALLADSTQSTGLRWGSAGGAKKVRALVSLRVG